LGHRIDSHFAAQLATLRPDTLNAPTGVATTVFSMSNHVNIRNWCLGENSNGRKVVHEVLDHPIIWTSDPLANQAIVPGEVTKRLVGVIR
jgi:hypothetical protein